MASERYTVTIARDHLVFSSAHFISFAGHQCEPLHGHNYRAALTYEGDLGDDFYVVDFVALTRIAKACVAPLDHRVLLATRNPVIAVEENPERVRVTYREKEWLFPRSDCVLLPIENTTAELLARHLASEVLESVRRELGAVPRALSVEVEENVGQSAAYHWLAGG